MLCVWVVGGNKTPGVFGYSMTHWVSFVTVTSLPRLSALYFIHSAIDPLHRQTETLENCIVAEFSWRYRKYRDCSPNDNSYVTHMLMWRMIFILLWNTQVNMYNERELWLNMGWHDFTQHIVFKVYAKINDIWDMQWLKSCHI